LTERAKGAEPEIIVAPGQAEALLQLAALVESGVITPPSLLLEAGEPLHDLAAPEPIQLEPVSINPLDSGTSSSEARESRSGS
jgi:hypothetical protein